MHKYTHFFYYCSSNIYQNPTSSSHIFLSFSSNHLKYYINGRVFYRYAIYVYKIEIQIQPTYENIPIVGIPRDYRGGPDGVRVVPSTVSRQLSSVSARMCPRNFVRPPGTRAQ